MAGSPCRQYPKLTATQHYKITMKKIAVFTGTRAEYGLFYWLLKDIEQDPDLELQLIVSGSHLSQQFGYTKKQILADGFYINAEVEMLISSDTSVGTVKSIGVGLIGYADALKRLAPDFLLILGDRYEALAIAQCAMLMKVPIVHLHGGEKTEGAYDDAIRHAITKLSHYHFTATEEYRKRVLQLGEEPSRVFNVGAIGLDHLKRSQLLSLSELGESLGFQLTKPYFVVTYHPVTLANETAKQAVQELLNALERFPLHQVLLTYPNADDGGQVIINLLREFASDNTDRVYLTESLGQIRYLSAVKYADAVIGNSSSGIIEVPSFNVPTINIGARQKGRIAAQSVVNCESDESSIFSAIELVQSEVFRANKARYQNPYGTGDVSQKILQTLKKINPELIKQFNDITWEE